MTDSPVIVLEFNELTPSLVDRFIGEGALPNFARLRSESCVFTTLADERPPYLEPWIQWVTVHSGLPFSEHGVFRLNEGHKLNARRTWEVVSDAGHPVWVCGSMNVPPANGTHGCLLPDPWCTKVAPSPSELHPYFRFVQQNVLEHTNDRLPLTRADYLSFLAFMARRGLSPTSVTSIGRQLFDERRHDTRWKRVVLLDLLQFDVFAHYYRRLRPALSTFFLNSTAHYQHAYWDSMAPEAFRTAPSEEKTKFRDAIRFGYQKMDALIGRFLTLAERSGATIVFCTALSQQPSPDYDAQGGAMFYRPKSFGELANALGLAGPYIVQPVMSEQFYLEFPASEPADAAEALLGAATVGGRRLMALRREGLRVFTGCAIHDGLPDDAVFSAGGRERKFFDLFYRMDTGKTGVHHPDGMLWIRRPAGRHETTSGKVPLTAVAPTILNLLGRTPPSHMTTPPLQVA